MAFIKKLSLKKILTGLAIITLLVFLIWGGINFYNKQRILNFVIPAGTANALGKGIDANNFPDEIILTKGILDTLVIENQDDSVHSFGLYSIMPNTTLSKRFTEVGVFETACSYHPTHTTRLIVNPAPPQLIFRYIAMALAFILTLYAFWSVSHRKNVTKVTS